MRATTIYSQCTRVFWIVGVIVISAGAAGCAAAGPSEAEVQQIVDARAATTIAEVPTVTPAPIVATATPVTLPNTPTPAPTATQQATPTPQPTATPQPLPTDFSDVFAEYAHSVFRIETSSGIGTGWLLQPDLILTNQHVVEGSQSCRCVKTSKACSRRECELSTNLATMPYSRLTSVKLF